MSQAVVDGRYYEVAGPNSLADRLMHAARRRIVGKMAELHPFHRMKGRLLDVGVSDVLTGSDNMLERVYPCPWKITALGLGSGEDFRKEFPQVRYLQGSGLGPLPFDGRQFLLATSNAVLEHLGSVEAQEQHLSELLRVAEEVFISAPNRWFPIEHHTALPFLHWWRPAFEAACRVTGKGAWAREDELLFVTAKSLRRLVEAVAPGRRYEIGFTGICLGGLSSNLFLSIK